MRALLRHVGVAHVAVAVAFILVLGAPWWLRPKAAAEGDPGGAYVRPDGVPSRKLVIISPHSDSIRREFAWAFAEQTVREHGFYAEFVWLDVGGTLDAIRYVDDEFTKHPEGIGVDLFFGGGVDPFMHLGPKGLLHQCRLPKEVLAAIPQTYSGMELYDADQHWFGACLASFGLLYNKRALELLGLPEPREWADLGRPDYFTWVSSADPSHSGSMHMVYEIILQAYGWEKGWQMCTRIGANVRAFTRGAGDVAREVMVGDAAAGMAIDTYAFQAVAEAGPEQMGFRLPDRLTVVNPDAIAVLRGAPDAELAEMFIAFVLSERGQRLWILKPGTEGGPRRYALYRLPLIPGFAKRFGEDAAVTLDPFEFEAGIQFSPAKMSARWSVLNDLFGACVINVHEELTAAWEALRHLPADDPALAELTSPPVSEEDLTRLGATAWSDPKVRADTVARWSAEAQALYRRLRARAAPG